MSVEMRDPRSAQVGDLLVILGRYTSPGSGWILDQPGVWWKMKTEPGPEPASIRVFRAKSWQDPPVGPA
jgi:hypothetical protein